MIKESGMSRQSWYNPIKSKLLTVVTEKGNLISCRRYFKAVAYLNWIESKADLISHDMLRDHIAQLEDFINGKMDFEWLGGEPKIIFPFKKEEMIYVTSSSL